MDASQIPLPIPIYLQDEYMTQDFKDLISSLPKEKGWVCPYFYQYEGFWHLPRQVQGILNLQKNFQARSTDIFLVTTPKSGTTWLKAILFALVNRTTYPCTENHPLLSNNPHELVPFMELDPYKDKQDPNLSSPTLPRLFSTHMPYLSLPLCVKSSDCKIIYLCRNPLDTFVSIWHFTNNLRLENMGKNTLEDTLERFCKGVSNYGPYWDHVLGYWKESLESPEKVFFLKFEGMKENPGFHLRRIAEFLGCPISPEEEAGLAVDEILGLCSFNNLSNLKVNKSGRLVTGEEHHAFFRRGEVGDWKNYLTQEMIEKINQITEQKLGKYGLKF